MVTNGRRATIIGGGGGFSAGGEGWRFLCHPALGHSGELGCGRAEAREERQLGPYHVTHHTRRYSMLQYDRTQTTNEVASVFYYVFKH